MEPLTTGEESSLHFAILEAAASIGVCRTFDSQPFKERSFPANLSQKSAGDEIPKSENKDLVALDRTGRQTIP